MENKQTVNSGDLKHLGEKYQSENLSVDDSTETCHNKPKSYVNKLGIKLTSVSLAPTNLHPFWQIIWR